MASCSGSAASRCGSATTPSSDFTGIDDDALGAPLSTFSTGMGLRLGFSLIVHSEPSVLVVDEVLAVGDESFQERCIDRVETMVSNGCAMLLASHDLELVHEHCHRLTVLHDGEQRFTGPSWKGSSTTGPYSTARTTSDRRARVHRRSSA